MMHGTFNSESHPLPRAALPPLFAALLWVGGCVFAVALLAGGDANASDDCDPAMSDCGLQPAGPIGGPAPPIKPERDVRKADSRSSLSNKARANAAADKARIERGAAARGAQKLQSLPLNPNAVGSER